MNQVPLESTRPTRIYGPVDAYLRERAMEAGVYTGSLYSSARRHDEPALLLDITDRWLRGHSNDATWIIGMIQSLDKMRKTGHKSIKEWLRIQDYCLSGRPRHVHSTRLELLSTLLGLCDIREGDWQHLPKSVFRLGVRPVTSADGSTTLSTPLLGGWNDGQLIQADGTVKADLKGLRDIDVQVLNVMTSPSEWADVVREARREEANDRMVGREQRFIAYSSGVTAILYAPASDCSMVINQDKEWSIHPLRDGLWFVSADPEAPLSWRQLLLFLFDNRSHKIRVRMDTSVCYGYLDAPDSLNVHREGTLCLRVSQHDNPGLDMDNLCQTFMFMRRCSWLWHFDTPEPIRQSYANDPVRRQHLEDLHKAQMSAIVHQRSYLVRNEFIETSLRDGFLPVMEVARRAIMRGEYVIWPEWLKETRRDMHEWLLRALTKKIFDLKRGWQVRQLMPIVERVTGFLADHIIVFPRRLSTSHLPFRFVKTRPRDLEGALVMELDASVEPVNKTCYLCQQDLLIYDGSVGYPERVICGTPGCAVNRYHPLCLRRFALIHGHTYSGCTDCHGRGLHCPMCRKHIESVRPCEESGPFDVLAGGLPDLRLWGGDETTTWARMA